jgi:phage portal protein BeeE
LAKPANRFGVHKIGYSPDEMALDKLINYYESRICALMGVDPMVCGLGSGTMQKTYANLGEALNDFWERQIVPMLRRHASTLTAQLFPSFGMEASEWRLSFDTSEVAALQENVDALFTR